MNVRGCECVEMFRVNARQESHKLRSTRCPREHMEMSAGQNKLFSCVTLSVFPFFTCRIFFSYEEQDMRLLYLSSGEIPRKYFNDFETVARIILRFFLYALCFVIMENQI